MPTYLHPGVYIEEIPSGAKPIEGVGTSTAAFIGFTTKGPLNEPEVITGFDQYNDIYGGIRDLGSSAKGDAMGFSVRAFFQNGGTKTYVVRVAKNTATAKAKINHPAPDNVTDGLEVTAVNPGTWANGLILKLTPKASDPQLFTVEVGRHNAKGEFVGEEQYQNVSLVADNPRFVGSVVNDASPTVDVAVKALADISDPSGYFLGSSTSGDLSNETLDFTATPDANRKLTMSLDGQASFTIDIPAGNFTGNLASLAAAIQGAVRAGATIPRLTFTAEAKQGKLVLTSGTRAATSSAVVANSGLAADLELGTANGGTEITGANSLAAALASTSAKLVDGANGAMADDSAYDAVFTKFLKIRDINIVCLPDEAWDATGKPVVQAAISHAEKVKSRMVIVDPPAGQELDSETDVVSLGLPTSTYSVAYYPWVRVANPFYDAEANPGVSASVLVPPGGFAAGMWSKIDARRGVWKAPAGLETGLLGLAGLEYTVEDAEQDVLNPLGVNALRSAPGFNNKFVWGARTLSTRADPEWRYVPVRRTAIFIERSVYGGIQWAVFEPNDHRLWSSLRLNIQSFMDGLFRSGAFQGEKASDAYFVRCGLGDTMTQGDIDRGQVIVVVGFAPLKPAEFVIVRIQQKVGRE